MESLKFNPENMDDATVYTNSLSLIEKERNEIKKELDSLLMQGKGEDDMNVSGLRFKLKELRDQENEIRNSQKEA